MQFVRAELGQARSLGLEDVTSRPINSMTTALVGSCCESARQPSEQDWQQTIHQQAVFTKVEAMIRSLFDAGPFRGDLGRDDSLGINPGFIEVGSQLRLLVEAVASCQAWHCGLPNRSPGRSAGFAHRSSAGRARQVAGHDGLKPDHSLTLSVGSLARFRQVSRKQLVALSTSHYGAQ